MRHPIRWWEELKGILLRQFRSTFTRTLDVQWLDHRQGGGVVEYHLKGKIKAQVRVLGPTNLDQAIENRTQVAAKMGPKLGECIWSTTTNPT